MASLNKALLIGNIGTDVEVFQPENSQRKVLKFRLATSRRYLVNGEQREDTQWHTVAYWVKSESGIVNYLKKGTQVYVEGEIVYRKYTDQNGTDKYSTEISAQTVSLLGGIPQGQMPRQNNFPSPTQPYGQQVPNNQPVQQAPQQQYYGQGRPSTEQQYAGRYTQGAQQSPYEPQQDDLPF